MRLAPIEENSQDGSAIRLPARTNKHAAAHLEHAAVLVPDKDTYKDCRPLVHNLPSLVEFAESLCASEAVQARLCKRGKRGTRGTQKTNDCKSLRLKLHVGNCQPMPTMPSMKSTLTLDSNNSPGPGELFNVHVSREAAHELSS